jgi:hypothetical protein
MNMKFIYILVALSLLATGSIGQAFVPRTNGTFTPIDPFLSVPRALYIPKVCDTLVNPFNGGKDSVGAMVIDTCNQKVWIRTRVGGTKIWLQFSSIISEQHPVNWYNIKNAGADTSGAVDVSSYIVDAMNNGRKDIYLPKGTYLISNTVQMKDSVTIRGDGRQATVIKLAANTVGFKLGFALGGFKCQFLDIGFLGTDSTSGNGDQTGILIDSVNGVFVHNVGGYLLGGWTVRIRRNGYCCGTYTTTAPRGNIISNCYSQKCYGGYALDTVAEYNTIDNSTAVNGVYGAFIAGGNSRLNNNNLSSNTYGAYLTGGSNNAHGVAVGNTFNHNSYNIYVTGATNGFTFSANACYAASTQEVYIDNSDNVNFYGGAILVGTVTSINNTNCAFSNVRMSAPVWTITGNAPTVIVNGAIQNTLSIKDALNSNQLDISHLNKVVNFTVSSGGKFIFSDTVFTRHIASGTLNNDTLRLMSSTNTSPTQSGIKFGVTHPTNGVKFGYWDMRTGYLGIGTGSGGVSSTLHVRNARPTANSEVRISEDTTCGSCAARLLLENNGTTTTGQIFVGGTTNAFMPRGMLIHTTGSDGLKFATDGTSGKDIEFAGSVLFGTNSWAKFKGGTGNFLYNTTTDDFANGKFQIHSSSRFDSLMKLYNVSAPPSTYNVLVHSTTDSGTYQIPVSDISGGGMAIGGSITSATEGSVLFAGPSGVLAEDNASLFWNNTSNFLGIGTNVPTTPLDIPTHTGTTSTAKFGLFNLQSLSATNGFLFGNGYYNGSSVVYSANGEVAGFQFVNGDLLLRSAPSGTAGANATITTNVTVKNTGNVGIAEAFPQAPLHIYNASDSRIVLSNTGGTDNGFAAAYTAPNTYLYNRANGFLEFATNNTARMRITSTGKVEVASAIDNETLFTAINTGTTNASAISGTASGTTSIAVSGTSTQYIGVAGTSTSNNGMQGQSTSGTGVVGVSTTGAAFRGQVNPASTNAIENVVTLLRTTSAGAGANGLGAAIQYELETATSGTSQIAGSLAFEWIDATNATRTSRFRIRGVNSASDATLATFDGNGNVTFGTTNSIVGTATNNNAVAGNIGEYVQSVVASGSAVALSTGTTANVTSISLTAGDWDVTGVVDYAMTGATATNFLHGTSTTSATLGGQDSYAQKPFAFAGSNATLGDNAPLVRLSLSGTTTVYLVAQAAFSGGSVDAYGTIRARRVR